MVLIKHTRHNINTGMFLASLSLAELLLLLVYIPLEVFLFTFIFLSSAFNFHFFIVGLHSSSPLLLLFFLLITFTSSSFMWSSALLLFIQLVIFNHLFSSFTFCQSTLLLGCHSLSFFISFIYVSSQVYIASSESFLIFLIMSSFLHIHFCILQFLQA